MKKTSLNQESISKFCTDVQEMEKCERRWMENLRFMIADMCGDI